MILSMKYFFIAAIFLFHFSDCIAEETGDPAKIPVVANKVRGLTAGDAADDYFAGKMKKCADEWKKVKNPDPDALGMFEGLDCVEACHPQNGRTPHEKGLFEEKFKQCSEKESGAYKCGNIALCRSHVTYLHSDCRKKNASDPSCGDQARKLCYDACSLPSDNNCIPADAKNFEDGRALCASNPGRQLIGDREANQIIQQRNREIYTSSGDITQTRPPSSQLATSSVFYGGEPGTGGGGEGGSDGSTTADTQTGTTTTPEPVQTASAPPDATGGAPAATGGAGGSTPPAAGAGGGASLGGGGLPAMPSFNSGEDDSRRQSTFKDTGTGNRESFATDAVGSGNLPPGAIENGTWDTPSARNLGSSSLGGGSNGGGAGAAGLGGAFSGASNPSARVSTASLGSEKGGKAGSIESSSFQSGYHKANGIDKKTGKPYTKAQLARQKKMKKRMKRSDGSLDLRRLLAGSKKMKGRRPAQRDKYGRGNSQYYDYIGHGPHPVFQTVDGYYDEIRLDVNGEIDL